jgi:hypothetical protein
MPILRNSVSITVIQTPSEIGKKKHAYSIEKIQDWLVTFQHMNVQRNLEQLLEKVKQIQKNSMTDPVK